MKITDILVEGSGQTARLDEKKPPHAKASDPKPKKIKPTTGGSSPHPMRNKLVGGESAQQFNEGPVVTDTGLPLQKMIATYFDDFIKRNPSDEQLAEILKIMGMKLDIKGKRAVINQLKQYGVEVGLDEAPQAFAIKRPNGKWALSAKTQTPMWFSSEERAQQANASSFGGEGEVIAVKLKQDDYGYNGRTIDEGEQHGNSKIYDKCWKGYRKVPGKKRGEKGSCVKESRHGSKNT